MENKVRVLGIRFKKNGKIYYFNPADSGAELNDHVIVETARGLEYGTVVTEKTIDPTSMKSELKKVERIATDEDTAQHINNRNGAKEAHLVFEDRVAHHHLRMNLINVEYTFDRSKLLFYFTAEGRVDFRNLVRDLAQIFRTRIELRQIGVRDEAKTVGALGCCGRETCCSSFLSEFSPVSIKMAKDQGLSLNPTKISGVCGRLMCCLRYEQEGYECIIKRMPRQGEFVETPQGKGTVVGTYTIQELVKVAFNHGDEVDYGIFDLDDIKRTRKVNRAFKVNKSELKDDVATDQDLKALEQE
ncbi:stage 0 sporulation family protein [Peptoniphilus equinus]|uniref:Stage 0 sporulation family protein n=1 Tax=Peptoniphilus equinus TaxID=3016343 RepID=A0ABY7QTS0_9FIRM|nr:stage 0 sporulation family protein [Peptoniphilus equinus]WBW49756.1 stage 0 sporulation family protein [Peptoniphilus equinus]